MILNNILLYSQNVYLIKQPSEMLPTTADGKITGIHSQKLYRHRKKETSEHSELNGMSLLNFSPQRTQGTIQRRRQK